MSTALILAGGGLWLIIMITLVGYGIVKIAARDYRSAVVTLTCALFIAWLGAFAIGNAPIWAEHIWS